MRARGPQGFRYLEQNGLLWEGSSVGEKQLSLCPRPPPRKVRGLCHQLGRPTRVQRRGEDRAHTRSQNRSQLSLPGGNRRRSPGFQLLSAYLQGERTCIFPPKNLLSWIPPDSPFPVIDLTQKGDLGV